MASEFMQKAIAESLDGMRKNEGGPFGAVIVKDGEIVVAAHNEVIMTNDPTAHAEVTAIRKAAKLLGRFDLSDCEIYSSCEPCPMCLSAIYWAKIKRLHYGCTAQDAADVNFDDKFIYDAIRGVAGEKRMEVTNEDREECLAAFKEWARKDNRTEY